MYWWLDNKTEQDDTFENRSDPSDLANDSTAGVLASCAMMHDVRNADVKTYININMVDLLE